MARSGHLSNGAGHQAPAPDATWAAPGNAARLPIARSVVAGPGPARIRAQAPHYGGPCRGEARRMRRSTGRLARGSPWPTMAPAAAP